MSRQATRRDFLKQSTAAGLGLWFATQPAWAAGSSPNEKLNLGIIGPGGRGWRNLNAVSEENIVALAEVDAQRGSKAFEKFPKAARYEDFRKMLDKEDNRLDAVVVSTPDHTHAPASVMAMKRGKHCYCEKPLTHTVEEARVAAEVAKTNNLATQMGTQIHAGDNYRRVVEIIRSGAIGPVREVHVWVGKVWGGGDRPEETPPVPDHLDWDLWLGPAAERPYHPAYVPYHWRKWWAFGNGTLGDMGCHYIDLPFWALDLRHPTTVAADGEPSPAHEETCAMGLKVDYEFPARGEQPPVKLTWYDGRRTPKELYGQKLPGAGVLFVGEKGRMLAQYRDYKLLPEEEFADYEPPEPSIPRSIGHHKEWIHACKTGQPTTCNFDYSGTLTEAVLLGTVSYRVGQKLQWDAAALKATNCPEAEKFLRLDYREGWTL